MWTNFGNLLLLINLYLYSPGCFLKPILQILLRIYKVWKKSREKLLITNLPLLQTLLSSSGPLESLSLSSCRCKWSCGFKWWWWPSAKFRCKWCKWLLLLATADALKSRGLCGDGDRPFSTRSRLKCSAAPTFAWPPPPNMSVIMNRDLDGRTAIDPRCIGTVIPAAVDTPCGDNKSAELVIVEVFVGLNPPNECNWSTILIEFFFNRMSQKF